VEKRADAFTKVAGHARIVFERVRAGLARRAGLDIDLLGSAETVEELHPAEMIPGPPALALEGQFERITACGFEVDKDKEIAEVRGAPKLIFPTRRFVLRDVSIKNGTIFGPAQRKSFNNEFAGVDPFTEYDRVVLRSSRVGCEFFGHWLRDDAATHLLAEREGTPLSMPTPGWPDRVEYLQLFEQDYFQLGPSFIRELVLFDDIFQNAHKAIRFRELRARVAKNRAAKQSGHLVYLMRGTGGKARTLVNEAKLAEAVEKRGGVVVQAESMSVRELVGALLGATLIISVEGSQLSHALYTLAEGGGILAIQPPDRFYNSHMDWARALSMSYGIAVGEPRDTGFYLSCEDLLRTIDLFRL
jgi:hypothetical protein